MLKTLLHYRNPDSTLDIITLLSEFFKKGLVSGGTVTPVFPNSIPQVSVSPFKLIGQDGMVVLETSLTKVLTLDPNKILVICFKSQYVANGDPIADYEVLELSAYNLLSTSAKAARVVFAVVTTGANNALPVVTYDLRDVLDPIGRNTLRGTVASNVSLPAINNRLGDAYIVESGIPDPDNGLYVWKGTAGWENITDSISISSVLAQHRSNLFADEIHLTNAQADAVLGTDGTPSNTNRFVTDSDPRLPTQNENDALVGLSQTTPTAPDASNPFVTAAYNVGEPSEVVLSGVGGFITLNAGSGPFFVGLGVTAATAIQYFGAFDETLNREYLNTAGAGIIITGVYKSTLGPTPLNPSSEPTVVASNGFWNATVYLGYTGVIDSNVRMRFGKQLNLANLSRGFALKPGPLDAQTSSETLERLAEISGRLMDDPMLAGESNVELAATQKSLRRYLNTTTTSDMIVPGSDFPHMRSVADIASDFPADYGDIVEFGLSLANYTVKWSNTDVAAFDPGFTEDIPNLAVIAYAVGTILPAIKPGWTFIDDLGQTYRILAFNGALSILVYTGGSSVNVNNAAGNQSKIIRSNNPRRLELLYDFETSMGREFFPVDDIQGYGDHFEELPPGGVHVGSYTPPNNYSMIGTSVLPNQGNAAGSGRGRQIFQILPKQTGNRVENRLILIGNWESNQADFARQAVGNISQGSLGIEYTGRLSSLTLWTAIRSAMPYGFRVYVDGVYTHAASQFLTDANISAGLLPANAWSNLRGAQEKRMMPILFGNLGLSDDLIHTVRIEVTQSAAAEFPLYAISTFYNGAVEAKGRAYTSTDFSKTDTEQTFSPIASAVRGARVVRYLDRTTQARLSSSQGMPIIQSLTLACTAVATTLADVNIVQSALVGDVFLFTSRNVTVEDPANYVLRRITAIDRFNGTFVINAALGFALPGGGNTRAELVFRTPSTPSGIPVLGAPKSNFSTEYARFLPADWSVGLSRDVSELGTAAADSRTTVLDDGSTALSVINCRTVTTGIEGFASGIRLESTGSAMVLTGWGTRQDVVFSGNSGTSTTVDIEVDGQHSYTITVPNDGAVRHTLFYDGAPQSHTVKISNPSIAATIVVSEWIFHTIARPAYDGATISEYEIPRNATTAVSSYFDFAPTTNTNPLLVSNCGLRVFDITKYGARIYEGTTGTTSWSVTQDLTNNPRFGYVSQTDRVNAIMEMQFVGPHFEFYYLAGPDRGIAQFFVDGVVASSANFPSQVFGPGYSGATGQVDMYAVSTAVKRLILTNLSTTQVHTVRMQNTATKNGSSSGFFISGVAAAENAGTNVSNRRAIDDSQINRLHMQSFRDLRQFLTLSPDQVGVLSAGEATSSSNGLTLGYINSAYAMADGSGTPQNCTIAVVAAVTVVDPVWAWTAAVNPGTTAGDLEVIVDGQVIPRFVAGVTTDAYYKEDLTITGRINLWANLSAASISIEIRRKAGTIDSSTTNAGRIAVQSGIVVGTSAQVLAGFADYSLLATAVAAATTGQKITVLSGFASSETISVTKRLTIAGEGFDSHVTGTITLTSACDFATIRGIYATQFILQAGAVGNQVVDCFWDTDVTDVNAIGTNRITGMKTV